MLRPLVAAGLQTVPPFFPRLPPRQLRSSFGVSRCQRPMRPSGDHAVIVLVVHRMVLIRRVR